MLITRFVDVSKLILKVEISAARGTAASLPLKFEQISATPPYPKTILDLTGTTFRLRIHNGTLATVGTVLYTFDADVDVDTATVEISWTEAESNTLAAGVYSFRLECLIDGAVVAIPIHGLWRQGG